MSLILRIEFPREIPPIYLRVQRKLWISQYYKEISELLENNEPLTLFLQDSKPFPVHLNLGTVYDLYSTSTILNLKASFSQSSIDFDKDFFLQSLKESEYLMRGSISKIQSLSLSQVDQLLEMSSNRQEDYGEILNFPIKIYLKDSIILKKYSKSYSEQSLVRVLQENWTIPLDFIYFGVLLDAEFKFSDTLSLLTPDNWFHLGLDINRETVYLEETQRENLIKTKMELNSLQDFIENELHFYPHLLSKDVIITTDLFPFLKPKDRDEAIICKSLRNSQIVKPSLDSSYLTLSTYKKHELELSIYIQNCPETLLKDFDILKRTRSIKPFGFITLKTQKETEIILFSLKSLNIMALSFKEYLERLELYQLLLAEKKKELHLVKSNLYNSNISREIGTTCRFRGVHISTNTKILKKLFEIVSPVCFIEYDRSENGGIVRFKSGTGAKIACKYFTKEFIIQKTWNDLGSLSDSRDKITLKLLSLEEEEEYFTRTNILKRKSREEGDESVKRIHLKFEE